MKPLRIFIFFTATALLLFLLALVFPRQGIPISSEIHLKFMKLSELKRGDSVSAGTVVEQLLASTSVGEDPEGDFVPLVESGKGQIPVGQANPDGDVPREDSTIYVDPANVDSLKQAMRALEFPDGNENLLDPFFADLEGLLDGSVRHTRIMHFGDSQIEIDRMTALIRYRMQKQFGGSGCGLVQAMPLYSGHMAYKQEEEGDWLRYTCFGKRDTSITHNYFGIMGAFTAVPAPEGEHWPALHYTFNTGRRTGTFDRVAVFMHSYVEGARMALVVNDTVVDTIAQIPAGFSLVDFRHNEQISSLSLSMNLPEGGRVYGISFESAQGLQMDNIAMRGGSGLIFSRMNRDLQLRILEYLDPGLIILQFGGNVVPYINAERYYRSFKRELAFLRNLCPGTPIILIGPADMSLKVKGRFESYPGVEPVRNALRRAALESGCAFWDLYQAMGGANSMPSFVHSDPPLASTDYVHFTSLGVNLVAEMFYKALMAEYASYHQNH